MLSVAVKGAVRVRRLWGTMPRFQGELVVGTPALVE
jgi:hypothetical protein